METPEELKARFLVDRDGLVSPNIYVEIAYQLARIATALEKIEEEGIFNYPRTMKEEPDWLPETDYPPTSADNPEVEG